MRLTERERWLLRHLTRSSKWITRELGVRGHTVKNQMSALYRKFGIRDRRSGKKVRLLMRALEVGALEIADLDPADDERRWPEGWHWGWKGNG